MAASAAATGSADELVTVDDQPDPPENDPDAEQDHAAACAAIESGLRPMQLLGFTFAPGVKGKEPAGRLPIARPGQRVYAHLRMRNRSGRPRCVHVSFRVAGQERTRVTLKVGKSWSWRTWAYATLRGDDRGVLEVEVSDDQGATIVTRKLGIVAE